MKPKAEKKILVLDDDQAITEALGLALTSYNFDVKTSMRSSDLLPLIKSFKPNLLLLDYFLAGEAGTELAKKILEDENCKGVKIIMFSAHPSAKDDVDKLKVDGFVAKPFDIHKLVRQINSLLS